MSIKLFCLLGFMLINKFSNGQAHLFTNTVKGIVTDADSKQPMTGVTISLAGSNKNTISDSTGNFKLTEVPIGTQTFKFSGTGYETRVYQGIEVSSGKEVFLEATLIEKITRLNEIILNGNKKDNNALNEFASASARSFSLDDAKKYPITGFDPGRIVQNFAGVTITEDNSNAIVIRGNSPKGILWKLDGIEIPNPNHFGSTGSGGGNISMLSSSTLDKSDFYSGAFPAEFGNALSGVFDLRLRKGNKDKHEYSLMVGALGIEAAMEGPLSKKSSSSYLVNYRYSTFALVKGVAEIEGVAPDYQDVSFKVLLPTKKAGSFSIFGLAGINKSLQEPQQIDFALGGPFGPLFSAHEKGKVGVAGISHQIFLNRKSYIQTILAATADSYINNVDSLDAHNNYSRGAVGRTKFLNIAYKLSGTYNNKINSRNTIQAGITISSLTYNFNDRQFNPGTQVYDNIFDSRGNSIFYEGFAQWKWKLKSRVDIIPGVHYSILSLNHTKSIEPRISISYNTLNNQKFIVAAGLHSRPEHLSTYFFRNLKNNEPAASQDLKFAKAAHIVVGYHKKFRSILFKVEAYYQYLYDIAIEKNNAGFFSMINALSVYDLYDLDSALISTGTGKNYGLDITLEKPLLKNWHFLITGSVLKSYYSIYNGKEFPTKLDRGYQVTAITGKEWDLHQNEKRKFAINGKIVTAGGMRESPVDQSQSRLQGKVVYIKDQYYSKQTSPYFRADIGVSYKINLRTSTHTLMLDIQNIFNHKNIARTTYNLQSNQFSNEYGLGLFPLINYRVDF